MIREAIDRILDLAIPHTSEVGGVTYSDKVLTAIKEPHVSSLKVHTLKGLVELLSAGFESLDTKGTDKDKVLIHVVSPTEVNVIATASDKHARRVEYVEANCSEDIPRFPFGQFMDPEAFIISLQSVFVQKGDTDYLLRTTASLTTENVSTSDDDGISQRTAIRKGVALKADAIIRARVELAPFRTFREVEQPISEFLFRLRPLEGKPPLCALFEADGGKWRIEAMELVAAWLSRNSEVTVIS